MRSSWRWSPDGLFFFFFFLQTSFSSKLQPDGIKTAAELLRHSFQIPAPFGGIIRIRSNGSALSMPSQPAAQAPLSHTRSIRLYYHHITGGRICQALQEAFRQVYKISPAVKYKHNSFCLAKRTKHAHKTKSLQSCKPKGRSLTAIICEALTMHRSSPAGI